MSFSGSLASCWNRRSSDAARRMCAALGSGAAALLALLLGACDGSADEPVDADLIRARTEALQVDTRYVDALKAIEPLVARTDAVEEDLVRAGILGNILGRQPEAVGFADRAMALAPKDPAVNYLRGNLHMNVQEYPQAEACFRTVLAVDPGDNATRIQLADTLVGLEREDEAEALWRQVQSAGFEANPALYRIAIYKLSRALLYAGRAEESKELSEEHARLSPVAFRAGEPAPKDPEASTLGYGRLLPPKPHVLQATASTPTWPGFSGGPDVDLHGAEHLLARDLDRDGRIDLVGWGHAGLVVALQKTAGAFNVQLVHERPVLSVAAGDMGTGDGGDAMKPEDPRHALFHPPLELLCVETPGQAAAGSGVFVLYTLNDAGRYETAGPEGLQSGDARAGIFSDVDHDGDLDVVLATGSGLQVLRNDGVERGKLLVLPSASSDAGRAAGNCRSVLAEDFDGDDDVDFLVATEHGLVLLSNDRRERFSNVTAAWNVPQDALATTPAAGCGAPVGALDLDEDGRADLVLAGLDGTLRWARNEPPAGTPAEPRAEPGAGGAHFAAPAPLRADVASLPYVFTDIDLDGHVDLVVRRAEGMTAGVGLPARLVDTVAQALAPLHGAQRAGLSSETAGETGATGSGGAGGAPGTGSSQPFVVTDLDGDLRPDLVLLGAGHARVLHDDGPVGRALPLVLDGLRDNDEGIGSIVQLRAGPLYRRLYWRGPELLGLGEHDVADVLRITWPNGVLQHGLDLPAGVPLRLEQVNRLGGSCPFLYTWNGTRFEFISDVLGTTPLGLPMSPDLFVPFDHDEYVRIRGDQLLPRDGMLQLAITEELREVTYLDRAVLHAIDHPSGVEIHPDERFAFPPFPPHHVHTFTDVVSLPRVIASNGSDVTAQLAAVDDDCARPFRRLPTQYDGLADPWWLDLTLADTPAQRAALAAAPRIRLALTGWLQWGNSSVNMSAARNPDIAFDPPLLWVPDGDGWTPTGDPIGFPAGKTKTMIIDITDVVVRDDPRLRLSTTLQLSWDAIRLVLDADDAPYTDTALEPSAALLHYRGFSWPLDTSDGTLPEIFDWNDHAQPRWNQHPGRYTRYGSVLPLLSEADDMYAILGSGDCMRLDFAAAPLPPLPAGWTRDWLLYLDGWAKDRDPATASAERVEPLPFHAMSAYPPPAGESFPDDAAHRAWQSTWNTRDGAVLLAPLDVHAAPDGPRLDLTLKPVR